jgi:hypothetical protein
MNPIAQIAWLVLGLVAAWVIVLVIDWFRDAWINRPWKKR